MTVNYNVPDFNVPDLVASKDFLSNAHKSYRVRKQKGVDPSMESGYHAVTNEKLEYVQFNEPVLGESHSISTDNTALFVVPFEFV